MPTASSTSASSAAGPATTVAVTLQEWAVVPATTAVPAGAVTFNITNTGPTDVHEFVVLKTDLGAGSLPSESTGAVSEEGQGVEAMGEVEDVPVGESRELTLDLAPGTYVLLCNIYNEDEKEAHYAMGMRTDFTVGE